MNTHTINTLFANSQVKQHIPTTRRGRAIYTIDWFLNGKPILHNHDNPQLSVMNCHNC